MRSKLLLMGQNCEKYCGTIPKVQVETSKMIKCVPVTGPVVAQSVGRGIALLFHDRGTRRG